MAKRSNKYIDLVADTETGFATVDRNGVLYPKDEARVWLIGWENINTDTRSPLLHTIKDFMESIIRKYPSDKKIKRVFFHNLKFDFSFFEDWLYLNGYPVKEMRNYENNILYKATVTYKGHTFEFYDSYKLYPSSLASLGQVLGFPKLVGTYDYDKLRRNEEDFSDKEIKYFWRDIDVLREVMKMHFNEYGNRKLKLSRPSYAFDELRRKVREDDEQRPRIKYYGSLFGRSMFGSRAQFDFIHSAYYGGFTYVNPEYQDRHVGLGAVADCNSMYPSAMKEKYYPNIRSKRPMTKAQFEHFDPLDEQTFFVVRLAIKKLRLKPGKFPSLPKKTHIGSSGAILSERDIIGGYLTLTNLDYYWLLENYDVDYQYIKGVYFKNCLVYPFKSFVDEQAKKKVEAGRNGDKVGRYLAKNTMNSSYGKFGQSPDFIGVELDYNDDKQHVTYLPALEEGGDMRNIAVAVFITAKARHNLYTTIRATNECDHLKFTYCDTDSVHFLIDKEYQSLSYAEIFAKIGVKCDAQELGAWKVEDEFREAKYLREKVYIEVHPDGEYIIKCAGVDNQGKNYIHDQIKRHGWEWFTLNNGGLKVPCKRAKRISGGTIIEDYEKVLTNKESRRVYEQER